MAHSPSRLSRPAAAAQTLQAGATYDTLLPGETLATTVTGTVGNVQGARTAADTTTTVAIQACALYIYPITNVLVPNTLTGL